MKGIIFFLGVLTGGAAGVALSVKYLSKKLEEKYDALYKKDVKDYKEHQKRKEAETTVENTTEEVPAVEEPTTTKSHATKTSIDEHRNKPPEFDYSALKSVRDIVEDEQYDTTYEFSPKYSNADVEEMESNEYESDDEYEQIFLTYDKSTDIVTDNLSGEEVDASKYIGSHNLDDVRDMTAGETLYFRNHLTIKDYIFDCIEYEE